MTGRGEKRKRRTGVLGGCLILTVLLAVATALTMAATSAYRIRGGGVGASGFSFGTGKGEIGVLHVSGIIRSGGQSVGFLSDGGVGADALVDALHEAADNDGIKGVLIRINSPGGSAAASQEVYDAVKDYRERTENPVVVSMADMAASGGYYIAAAADEIYANPATLTGSIGVIMSFLNYEGLMDMFGAREEVFKSGPHKDIGSPHRPLTAEERAILQDAVDDVQKQFVRAVADGRRMDVETVKKLADGRFYTGSQARAAKLVDSLGGYRQALDRIGALTGLGADPPTVNLVKTSIFGFSLGTLANSLRPGRPFENGIGRIIEGLLMAPVPSAG